MCIVMNIRNLQMTVLNLAKIRGKYYSFEHKPAITVAASAAKLQQQQLRTEEEWVKESGGRRGREGHAGSANFAPVE